MDLLINKPGNESDINKWSSVQEMCTATTTRAVFTWPTRSTLTVYAKRKATAPLDTQTVPAASW